MKFPSALTPPPPPVPPPPPGKCRPPAPFPAGPPRRVRSCRCRWAPWAARRGPGDRSPLWRSPQLRAGGDGLTQPAGGAGCQTRGCGAPGPGGFIHQGGAARGHPLPAAFRKREKKQSLVSKPTRGWLLRQAEPNPLASRRLRLHRGGAGVPSLSPRSALAARRRPPRAPRLAGQHGAGGRGRRDDDGGHVQVLLARGRRRAPVAAHARLQACKHMGWGSGTRGQAWGCGAPPPPHLRVWLNPLRATREPATSPSGQEWILGGLTDIAAPTPTCHPPGGADGFNLGGGGFNQQKSSTQHRRQPGRFRLFLSRKMPGGDRHR